MSSLSGSSRGALWRDRDFLRLWSAQTVSDFGARITRDGLPMMAVVSLAALPGQLGVLYALTSGAALVVGLSAGGYIDGTLRRPILIATDLIRAAVLISLPVAAWLGVLSMVQVYVVAALVASASVFFDIADHAYLPGLVGKAQVVDANARIAATESVAEMGGPALAGVLFQWLTAPFAVVVNAVTYLVSAVLLAGIRAPEPPPVREDGDEGGWLHGVVTGARTAWSEARVRVLLIMSATGGLFGGFFGALYIAFVLRDLGLNPALLGIGIATGGVGALAGSAIAMPMARRLGVGPTICVAGALAALGVMIVLLAPTNTVGAMACLMVSQFLGDCFGVVPLVLATSLRQSVLPGNVLGRVDATFRATGGGAAVVGALAGGALGQVLGMRVTLLLAVAGLMIGPLVGMLSPLRKVREMPA